MAENVIGKFVKIKAGRGGSEFKDVQAFYVGDKKSAWGRVKSKHPLTPPPWSSLV